MLSPDTSLVRRILLEDIKEYSYLWLSPFGGERYGMVGISSIPANLAKNTEESLIMLFKIDECCGEEWTLTDWNRDDIQILLTRYSDLYNKYSNRKKTCQREFIEWLKSRATETIRGQYKGVYGTTLNQPVYMPNKNIVESNGLSKLDFLSRGNLKMIVKDKWNDSIGVFKDCSNWYLVNWCTNA